MLFNELTINPANDLNFALVQEKPFTFIQNVIFNRNFSIPNRKAITFWIVCYHCYAGSSRHTLFWFLMRLFQFIHRFHSKKNSLPKWNSSWNLRAIRKWFAVAKKVNRSIQNVRLRLIAQIHQIKQCRPIDPKNPFVRNDGSNSALWPPAANTHTKTLQFLSFSFNSSG